MFKRITNFQNHVSWVENNNKKSVNHLHLALSYLCGGTDSAVFPLCPVLFVSVYLSFCLKGLGLQVMIIYIIHEFVDPFFDNDISLKMSKTIVKNGLYCRSFQMIDSHRWFIQWPKAWRCALYVFVAFPVLFLLYLSL